MTTINMKDSVASVVEKIVLKDGGITPVRLVDEARPKDSPIHDAFEWNDKVAGEQFRLNQARNWLRRIVINHSRSSPNPQRIVWVSPSDDEVDEGIHTGTYRPIKVVVQNKDEFARALTTARNQLLAAQRSVSELLYAAKNGSTPKMTSYIEDVLLSIQALVQALQEEALPVEDEEIPEPEPVTA